MPYVAVAVAVLVINASTEADPWKPWITLAPIVALLVWKHKEILGFFKGTGENLDFELVNEDDAFIEWGNESQSAAYAAAIYQQFYRRVMVLASNKSLKSDASWLYRFERIVSPLMCPAGFSEIEGVVLDAVRRPEPRGSRLVVRGSWDVVFHYMGGKTVGDVVYQGRKKNKVTDSDRLEATKELGYDPFALNAPAPQVQRSS